jgi:NAD(P)-dependent dehydrogenase (short-subunit alcohol dehydrogenase family)
MPGRLLDKVCLITGGAQGIGRAAALRFASEGAQVIIVDVNEEAGGRTAAEGSRAGGQCRFIRCDVSRSEDVRAAIAEVHRSFHRLHVLYNNASVYLPGRDGRITDVAEEVWHTVLGINLTSIYLFCHYGIPLMIESGGGSIINTASSAGVIGNTASSAGVIGIPGCDVYTASKGATISLTRSLAVEYRPWGIRANCIAPAGIRTPMLSQSNLGDTTFDEQRFLQLRTPSRRYGTPEEIAEVAIFLASEESSYVNGAVIVADGGITINGDLSKTPADAAGAE